MTTAEVPEVHAAEVSVARHERRFTDLLREGKSSAKTVKIKRLVNSLKWRHQYQNADHYSIEMCDETVITVKQVSNGEIMGLGTGVSVWPAAHVLSKYVERRYGCTALCGLRVCDIGSGTGCTGFVAAALGAQVTLTDQLQILPFLEGNKKSICQLNKQINPDNILVSRYDWGESAAHLDPPFDIVLISDCVLPKLYPILPLIEAVAAIMGPGSIALFSYEHRLYPYFDPRQEFRRLASKLGLSVRVIPLCEHDSYYCLDDVEIWELSFESTEEETEEVECTGEISLTIDDNCCGGIPSVLDAFNAMSTVATSAKSSTSPRANSSYSSYASQKISPKLSPRKVEMLSWGSIPLVRALLLDEVVQIKQDPKGEGTGGTLWASAVILARFILSDEFDMRVFSISKVSSDGVPRKTPLTVIDLGAGCGLTSIALLKKGYNVIATDRQTAIPLLQSNINTYVTTHLAGRAHTDSNSSGILDQIQESHPSVRVVEFDWQQCCLTDTDSSDTGSLPSVAHTISPRGGMKSSLKGGPTAVINALRSFQSSVVPVTETTDPTSTNDSAERSPSPVPDILQSPIEIYPDILQSPVEIYPGIQLCLPPIEVYPDVIVCSDCVYASPSVEPLLKTISWLAGPDTLLLISNEMRTALDHFISEARMPQEGPQGGSKEGSKERSSVSRGTHTTRSVHSTDSTHTTHTTHRYHWVFEDIHVDDLEVYKGDQGVADEPDGSNGVTANTPKYNPGQESGPGSTGAAGSIESNTGSPIGGNMSQKSFSYSTVNRPVRVLIGRNELLLCHMLRSYLVPELSLRSPLVAVS